jgi:hypothetical protein
LKEKYTGYRKGLAPLGLDSQEDRRKDLYINFARKCLKNYKVKHMFPINPKSHEMGTRHQEQFQVQFAHTGRLQKSSIIHMQDLLNEKGI